MARLFIYRTYNGYYQRTKIVFFTALSRGLARRKFVRVSGSSDERAL